MPDSENSHTRRRTGPRPFNVPFGTNANAEPNLAHMIRSRRDVENIAENGDPCAASSSCSSKSDSVFSRPPSGKSSSSKSSVESQENNQGPKSDNAQPTGQQNTQAPGAAKPAEEASPEPSKGDPNGPEGDGPGQPSATGASNSTTLDHWTGWNHSMCEAAKPLLVTNGYPWDEWERYNDGRAWASIAHWID